MKLKAPKILLILICCYVGIVVLFESAIGFFQPSNTSTLVITTTDSDGTQNERVLARFTLAGNLYVAANHWPRTWYRSALVNPDVKVKLDDDVSGYTAVPVVGDEHNLLAREYDSGLAFRILTGFPPRYFIRLEPD